MKRHAALSFVSAGAGMRVRTRGSLLYTYPTRVRPPPRRDLRTPTGSSSLRVKCAFFPPFPPAAWKLSRCAVVLRKNGVVKTNSSVASDEHVNTPGPLVAIGVAVEPSCSGWDFGGPGT